VFITFGAVLPVGAIRDSHICLVERVVVEHVPAHVAEGKLPEGWIPPPIQEDR